MKQQTELHVARARYSYEVVRRAPWAFFATIAGIVMILVSRNFEIALSQNIELVFFIPMIVYISGSIGAETLALFVRELALQRVSFKKLLLREIAVGLSLGVITGLPMALFSYVWLADVMLSVTVAITMCINGLITVLVGMTVPLVFAKLKKDPALGTDEITTAISDIVSICIYFVVTTVLLL